MKTVKLMGALRVYKLMDVDTDDDQTAKTTAMNAAFGGPDGWNVEVNTNDGKAMPVGEFVTEILPYVEPAKPSVPVADDANPESDPEDPTDDDEDDDDE